MEGPRQPSKNQIASAPFLSRWTVSYSLYSRMKHLPQKQCLCLIRILVERFQWDRWDNDGSPLRRLFVMHTICGELRTLCQPNSDLLAGYIVNVESLPWWRRKMNYSTQTGVHSARFGGKNTRQRKKLRIRRRKRIHRWMPSRDWGVTDQHRTML